MGYPSLSERIASGIERITVPPPTILATVFVSILSFIFSWIATGHCTFFTYHDNDNNDTFSVGLYSAKKVDDNSSSICVKVQRSIGAGYQAGRVFGIWANMCVTVGLFLTILLFFWLNDKDKEGPSKVHCNIIIWSMASFFHLLTFTLLMNTVCDEYYCTLGTAGIFNVLAVLFCSFGACLCYKLSKSFDNDNDETTNEAAAAISMIDEPSTTIEMTEIDKGPLGKDDSPEHEIC